MRHGAESTDGPASRERRPKMPGPAKTNQTARSRETTRTRAAVRVVATPNVSTTRSSCFRRRIQPSARSRMNPSGKGQDREIRHAVTLTRPFALLDREITLEELIAFSPYVRWLHAASSTPKPTDAGFGADWYDSVAFCRWLGSADGIAGIGSVLCRSGIAGPGAVCSRTRR